MSDGIFKTMVEIDTALKTHKFPFATIVVDPVNELYRRLLEEFSSRAVSPTLPTYQAVGVHIERFCRMLCESPDVNAIFVSHELPVKDEGTGTMEKLPATGTTNPALGQKIMGMVDIVGYAAVIQQEDGKPLYVAQLLNGKGRRGGDRFDSLVVNPAVPYREMDLTAWFATGPQPPETKTEVKTEPAEGAMPTAETKETAHA